MFAPQPLVLPALILMSNFLQRLFYRLKVRCYFFIVWCKGSGFFDGCFGFCVLAGQMKNPTIGIQNRGVIGSNFTCPLGEF